MFGLRFLASTCATGKRQKNTPVRGFEAWNNLGNDGQEQARRDVLLGASEEAADHQPVLIPAIEPGRALIVGGAHVRLLCPPAWCRRRSQLLP